MYSYELIETYMRHKNYRQAKQAAMDLGFSDAYVSNLKTGKKKLAEKSAIYIATECNLDIAEVLIKLQEEKATDAVEKAAWTAVLKKYEHGIIQTITMVYAIPLLTQIAVHINNYYV